MSNTSPAPGFLQKALIVVVGVAAAGVLAFFVWLASSVIEIKIGVAQMNEKIQSLMDTRREQATQATQHNSDRLDRIEGNRQ